MSESSGNPVLVEVIRGDAVESRHRGAAVVMAADGRPVAAWGDIERPVYPRSAIKPLQVLPLLETGAAEAFDVSDAEIALACASHNGETDHVERVTAWLGRLGLDMGALECGAHLPMDAVAAEALIKANRKPTRLHNNCSGKHTGMLTSALHHGEPVKGYTKPDHPVQRRIRTVLEEMGGADLSAAPVAIDGCSVPTIAMPLSALAWAMAAMAAPASLPAKRRDAVLRVRRAMTAHPYLVAGRRRFCTAVMARKGDAVQIKTGAEGVFTAALPGPGLGVAVKVDDGAGRAAEVAVAAILHHLDVLDDGDWSALADHTAPSLVNHAGLTVGAIRTAKGWPD